MHEGSLFLLNHTFSQMARTNPRRPQCRTPLTELELEDTIDETKIPQTAKRQVAKYRKVIEKEDPFMHSLRMPLTAQGSSHSRHPRIHRSHP